MNGTGLPPAPPRPAAPTHREGDTARHRRWWAAACLGGALLLAVTLLVNGRSLLRSGPATPGVVSVVFDPTTDPTEQQDADRLRVAPEFPTIARLLSQRVWLPADVTIRFASGPGGAAYAPDRHELLIPYGFVGQIRTALAERRPQSSPAELDAAAVQATVGVVLHETGHVLVAAYRLPVLGGEEVVADTFAAISVRLVGDEIDGLPADLTAYADFLQGFGDRSATVDLFDDHLPAQLRAARMRCLVYGSDPTAHADLAAGIPAADLPYCTADFDQAHDSWLAVLQQYRQN